MKQGESIYDASLYSAEQVKESLVKFLKIAGYEIIKKTIGFNTPDIYAERENHQIVISVKERILDAVEGCRDLAAIKCFLGEKKDYVVALPPVSETEVLEFLVEKTEWYFPMSEQAMMFWLVNPDRMEVHPILGYPYDEIFLKYLTNPEAANLVTHYVSGKISQKMIDEDDLF